MKRGIWNNSSSGLMFVLLIATFAAYAVARSEDTAKLLSDSPGITSVSRTMTYQGILTDASGNPIESESRTIIFKIYDALADGTELWSQSTPITTDANGYFSANLNNLNLPFDEDYFLELQLQGEQPMTPRQLMGMAGFAAYADTSEYSRGGAGGSGSGWVDDDTVIRLETSTDNVGIGTSSPDGKLEIFGNSQNTTNLVLSANYPDAWRWRVKTIDRGGGDVGLDFTVSDADDVEYTVMQLSRPATGRPLFSIAGGGLTFRNGAIGIGTNDPRASMDVAAAADNGGTLIAARLGHAYNHWTYFGDGHSGRIRGSREGYLYLSSNPNGSGDKNIYFNASGENFVFDNGSVGIGTTNPQHELDVNGTTSTQVLQITGGADIAEPFPISHSNELLPGSVVIIDEDNPGQLTLSSCPYDRRVAGIISGAGGVNPGLTLSQEDMMDGDQNVALSGRVYALATTANGAIRPGDLLTTSEIPGHAMKATEFDRAHGTVIGKAMSSLEDGEDLVLVLVSLQ